MTESSRRCALLCAALGFGAIRWPSTPPPAASGLASYMDSWRGLGAVVDGMMRQDFEVVLSSSAQGWSATFLSPRPEGGAPGVVGWAEDAKPWIAVQRAASKAINDPRMTA
jgi:hypothetical protein